MMAKEIFYWSVNCPSNVLSDNKFISLKYNSELESAWTTHHHLNLRKLPTPGFQVEIVMIDYDGTFPSKDKINRDTNQFWQCNIERLLQAVNIKLIQIKAMPPENKRKKTTMFSDSDAEEPADSRTKIGPGTASHPKSGTFPAEQISSISHQTEQLSLGRNSHGSHVDTSHEMKLEGIQRASSNPNVESTDLKAVAADASVFSFGDDEDDESD